MKPRLFVATRVHTFAHEPAKGTALLTRAGRVERVGAYDQLKSLQPDAEVIDLGNAIITPGLTDAHIHITEWAIARQQVQLGAAGSIDECLTNIRKAPHTGSWVQGRGWNPHHWGGAYPDKKQLDAVIVGVPAVFQSHDMHALWVNSAALQIAGIDSQTPDPEGGRIVRDERGEPTGMLLETAAQLVAGRIPLVTMEDMLAAVLDAQRELHRYGITGIHSFPGVHLPDPDPGSVVEKLRERGQLMLRVLEHISATELDAAIQLGWRSGLGDDWVRAGGVKMFLDGALGSRTAWMREPYESSADTGVQVLQESEFRELVFRAATAGIAAVVHAIGDAAVARAFDVLSEAPRVSALPHRVEHVQCFPFDRQALLRQGIICSVQPCHLMSDWQAADRHWGRRAAATYAFRTMLDGGAVLACGSDAPVEPADPRLGLYAAVARRDTQHRPAQGWHAEQSISIAEAMAGYTRGAAWAAGVHDTQGVLQPGACADFVAWKTDPMSCSNEELLELEVAATAVNGELVWEI